MSANSPCCWTTSNDAVSHCWGANFQYWNASYELYRLEDTGSTAGVWVFYVYSTKEWTSKFYFLSVHGYFYGVPIIWHRLPETWEHNGDFAGAMHRSAACFISVTNKRNSVKFRSNGAPDFIRKLLVRISNGRLYVLLASYRGFS